MPMPDKEFYNFILELLKTQGFAGLGFLLLCAVVWYQERKHTADRKEFRKDFITQYELHRKDRNEWIATSKDQTCKILSAYEKASQAMLENARATAILTVHIESCTKK